MRAVATLGRLAAVVGLCALPAHGSQSTLSTQILYALTPIDRSPSRADLAILGDPPEALTALRAYATEQTAEGETDFGAQLRAIRAIPQFCPDASGQCRDGLLAVFDDIEADSMSLPGPTAETPGQQILRRRAAIEALGAAIKTLGDAWTSRSVDLTLLVGYLDDASRDIRLAAVRALRDICDPAAIQPLQVRRAREPVAQLITAIDEALVVLAQCGP